MDLAGVTSGLRSCSRWLFDGCGKQQRTLMRSRRPVLLMRLHFMPRPYLRMLGMSGRWKEYWAQLTPPYIEPLGLVP
jgi:hypothetical protein